MTFAELQQRFLSSGVGRWYAGREPNEQRVILALAGLIVLTVFWVGLWKPIADWRETAHNRYQNAQAQLDWLRANEERARALSRSTVAGGDAGRSLLPVITRSAQSQNIQVNRLQPEASGIVSVSIQDQPFNDLLRWLHSLQENNGVTVRRMSVDADERAGIVNAQIRLQ
ncbi:MAG TPA: type II secretion system protein M [Pseudomonadales bacterium]